ncbi:MAG TPA: hypothetical protein PLB56_06535 [Spirochaetales bacterium]|nr:hypothetical protein [Spirochaetales bacterium]
MKTDLPPVRRMRLWRLYAEDGRRFLDLRLLDNRGFLGAKGRFAGTRAKNGIDLGLLKEAPGRHADRLRKALAAEFPRLAAFRFFRNEERALATLSRTRSGLYDPLARHAEAEDRPAAGAGRSPAAGMAAAEGAPALAVHRFFLAEEDRARLEAFPALLIPLPCPEPFGPAVLGFSEAEAAASVPEDELPPIMPFTAMRAWEDFRGMSVRLTGGRRARSGEGTPAYAEDLWKRSDRRLTPFFERRGPYLYARCARADWEGFRARALEAGCVLTPEWELPSIVPGDFDDGELKNLAKALEIL